MKRPVRWQEILHSEKEKKKEAVGRWKVFCQRGQATVETGRKVAKLCFAIRKYGKNCKANRGIEFRESSE